MIFRAYKPLFSCPLPPGTCLGVVTLAILLMLVLLPARALQAQSSDPLQVGSIAELLEDGDDDGQLDRLGQKVAVRGRATVDSNVLNDQYLLIYIQDRTAGIMVFSESLDTNLSEGDSLQVTGTLAVHNSKPEIIVNNLKVLQSGRPAPEARPLDRAFKDPEAYRGLLVSGEAVVHSRDPSENIKMLQIAPELGSDDSLHIFVSRANIHNEDFQFDAVEAGDPIHIRGILIRYISESNGKKFYQILPRSPDDLTISNLQPMIKEGSFVYADMDTASSMIYVLLESGLWGYDMTVGQWDFLTALEHFDGSFSAYEFGFNTQTNNIQLWSRGMGKLYNIEPETYSIKRVDRSSEHQNQYGHFPFFRDSTLYAFGGYGYWDYSNMLIHYDQLRNKWALESIEPRSYYPSRRVPKTGMYDRQEDLLYIYGGWGTESGNPENQNSGLRKYQDIWRFSFADSEWEKVMVLAQPENGSNYVMHPSMIGDINKSSSSLYLPNRQMWFIPTFSPEPMNDAFYFRAVHLPSEALRGTVSSNLDRFSNFLPTNYFYHPDQDEAVFVGINNFANADTYPLSVHRMPADSLMAKISTIPYYKSAEFYFYTVGLLVIVGLLVWFYTNKARNNGKEKQEAEPVSYQQLMAGSRYNSKEKRLIKHMHEHEEFMESQEIEELLWSDIDSYDYRRRLRNDILKDIDKKFERQHPGSGPIIIRKKDPNDNRRYLYGLNTELIEQ